MIKNSLKLVVKGLENGVRQALVIKIFIEVYF